MGGSPPEDDSEECFVSLGRFLGAERERPEEIDGAQMAPIVKAFRQHAHDFVGLTVDANRAANNARIELEPIPPHPLAQDDDAIAARGVFVSAEVTANLNRSAE